MLQYIQNGGGILCFKIGYSIIFLRKGEVYMVAINKISPIINNSYVGQGTKNVVKKAALPTVSALGVLAGSSLGGGGEDFVHAPIPSGASVTDPFLDQLGYAGDQALNFISEVGGAVAHGAENIADKALDVAADFLDFIS